MRARQRRSRTRHPARSCLPSSTTRTATTLGCAGCPFHNAAVEASGAMPGDERIVHLHKPAYVDGLINLAREAGAGDPEMLGNQLALLYEGASALSISLNDPAPWPRARAAAEALISMWLPLPKPRR
jgi:hypothetical protein